jgi:hypothetical protein
MIEGAMRHRLAACLAVGLCWFPSICLGSITPIRLGIYPGLQIPKNCDLVGFEFGLLMAGSTTSHRTIGIQVTPGPTTNRELIGLSIGSLTGPSRLWGINIGLLSGDPGEGAGMQLGLVNGFTIEASHSFDATRKFIGLKVGGLNNRDYGPSWGVDIGLINREREHHGLQIGLLNIAQKLYGVQIGLWNEAATAKGRRRAFPIINAAF